MSKKNDTIQQEPADSGSPAVENQQANSGSPTVENPQEASGSPAATTAYDDLLKNGTAILEAPTREALAELVDNIPADCKYCVGAVGRNRDNGTYTLRVDVTKK